MNLTKLKIKRWSTLKKLQEATKLIHSLDDLGFGEHLTNADLRRADVKLIRKEFDMLMDSINKDFKDGTAWVKPKPRKNLKPCNLWADSIPIDSSM